MSEIMDLGEHPIVCDFCLAVNPRWAFKVEDPKDRTIIAIADAEKIGLEHRGEVAYVTDNDGVWLACTRCSQLIERGLVERLAIASVEGATARFREPQTQADYRRVLSLYEGLLPTLGPRHPASDYTKGATTKPFRLEVGDAQAHRGRPEMT